MMKEWSRKGDVTGIPFSVMGLNHITIRQRKDRNGADMSFVLTVFAELRKSSRVDSSLGELMGRYRRVTIGRWLRAHLNRVKRQHQSGHRTKSLRAFRK